ncbi:hypothetical protein APHAL10511_007153 [Amanita phalloides]|nr:hypothetical protein APHAL10511_007153 [Amanita phalloides]
MVSRQLLLLFGIFINILLYALELALLYIYFREGGDSKNIKRDRIIIVINFLSDSICSLAVCYAMYLYIVTGWGGTLMRKERSSATVILVTAAISAHMMQLFSIHCYLSASERLEDLQPYHSLWSTIVHRGTKTLVTIGAASSILVAVVGLSYNLIKLVGKQEPGGQIIEDDILTFWLSSTTIAYIVLAISLMWGLYRIETFVNHRRRLFFVVTAVIEANIPAATVAIITLILSAIHIKNNIPLVFISILGRISTCTILLAFILRKDDQEHCMEPEASIGVDDQAANNSVNIPDALRAVGLDINHDIELGSFSEISDGLDSVFSHATSLSEVEIDRRVQEVAARETVAMTPYSVFTIAGSDSSGGAGIQADLKTIAAFGCYGASAVTALTAQNTTGVQDVHPCPPAFVERQIASVLQDIVIDAFKTGMLYDGETIKAVAKALKAQYKSDIPPVVCDPVCVSTSGHTLLLPQAIGTMIQDLFPLATVVTPNKLEAETLLSCGVDGSTTKITTVEDMISASKKLLEYGCRAVLLKGGHISVSLSDIDRVTSCFPEITIERHGLPLENTEILHFHGSIPLPNRVVVDVLSQDNGETTLFVRPQIQSKSTHGTGCTLSSALACELARGICLVEATKNATIYVYLGITTAPDLGRGYGPLNHLHSIQRTSLCKPTQMNPFPLTSYLIEKTAVSWKAYVQHDFVRLLGKGSLDRRSFVHFIKQDYHYLKYYSRAYGLLAAKYTDFSSISDSAAVVLSVIDEIGNHKKLCQQFGVTMEELENTLESTATTAYGAYILDTGLQGDATKLFMALIACLLGYGEVGLWLKSESQREETWVVLHGNPYKAWIDIYSGTNYQNAVKKGLDLIEARAAANPPSEARLQDWLTVWRQCTNLERGFWDMAMNLS